MSESKIVCPYCNEEKKLISVNNRFDPPVFQIGAIGTYDRQLRERVFIYQCPNFHPVTKVVKRIL